MALPQGFVLETPAQPSVNLPAGFQLETPSRQNVSAEPARRSYAAGEIPAAALKNLPSSAAKFGREIVEMVTSPIQTAKGLVDIGAGAIQNVLPQGVVDFVNSFSSDPANAERAVAAANAAGGMYKDRYGSYDSIKRTLAEDPVAFAADLSTLLSGGAGAAKAGGMTKTATGLTKAAAYTNPLQPVAFGARAAALPLREVGKIVNTAFNAKNALLMRAAEGQAPEIINALRNAQEIVPGSLPTAAEAAAGTGVVGYQQLGRSAARELPTSYKARKAEQGEAQRAAIQQVGKTPEELAQAEALRAATAEKNYGLADQILASTDQQYGDLLKRPAMQAALTKARELAANKDVTFEIGQTRPKQVVPSSILDEQGRPIGETVIPAQVSELPGTSIQFIKEAFDDLINDPNAAGFKGNEARAITGVKNEFLKWADTKNPPYAQARSIFADQSKPVNQMQIGQYLEQKFTPTLGQGTAADRASAFAAALESAPSTIKKATGENRYKTLTEALTPDQIKILDDVKSDLARTAKSRNLASGTLKQEFDVSKATSAIGGETIFPNMINTITTVTNTVWRKLRGQIDQKLAAEIATEMLFPGEAAAALEKAFRQQQRRALAGEVLSAPGKAIMKAPASVNMLGPEEQNQNALAR
jgi:hypothetical protein